MPSFPHENGSETGGTEDDEGTGPRERPETPGADTPDETEQAASDDPALADGQPATPGQQRSDPEISDPTDAGGQAGTAEPPASDATATTDRVVHSGTTDPRGDTTAPLLGSAPDWADLVAGSVRRAGNGDVTITIEFAEPPEQPRSGTTANVASFHDLTGDGRIDLEIWLNHSEQGWFPSWRDHREAQAAFGEDAGLHIDTDDARLEIVVPAEHFGEAVAWRWSMGLEWGRHEWLGTSAAAHDLAPDEGFVTHGGEGGR